MLGYTADVSIVHQAASLWHHAQKWLKPRLEEGTSHALNHAQTSTSLKSRIGLDQMLLAESIMASSHTGIIISMGQIQSSVWLGTVEVVQGRGVRPYWQTARNSGSSIGIDVKEKVIINSHQA